MKRKNTIALILAAALAASLFTGCGNSTSQSGANSQDGQTSQSTPAEQDGQDTPATPADDEIVDRIYTLQNAMDTDITEL